MSRPAIGSISLHFSTTFQSQGPYWSHFFSISCCFRENMLGRHLGNPGSASGLFFNSSPVLPAVLLHLKSPWEPTFRKSMHKQHQWFPFFPCSYIVNLDLYDKTKSDITFYHLNRKYVSLVFDSYLVITDDHIPYHQHQS